MENYSMVPFVLLHSAYPYTREAGYLATVYKHVYLDIGEVFPMVSRDGQKSILRQSLEIVPGSKLLYSTDGHWFPETFWLANKQFREVWLEVSSMDKRLIAAKTYYSYSYSKSTSRKMTSHRTKQYL
jgi:predicted TIM-barrel fold metal-dependent hydrolase